jgi:tRNA A-37 threonylcarbamoyl transferase component Bud32
MNDAPKPHETVPPTPHATVIGEDAEQVGGVIGSYKLMELIGEGGFGLVFVAEQQKPVRRRVAIKVIKPGMDTREVISRFEAERQALALMDHPNIARVLDAGTTDSGRPYFVMELVHGIPITEYCDRSRLTPRERLHLFVSVCHAVQHAHQKGIIHRDIKPSNVLVTAEIADRSLGAAQECETIGFELSPTDLCFDALHFGRMTTRSARELQKSATDVYWHRWERSENRPLLERRTRDGFLGLVWSNLAVRASGVSDRRAQRFAGRLLENRSSRVEGASHNAFVLECQSGETGGNLLGALRRGIFVRTRKVVIPPRFSLKTSR